MPQQIYETQEKQEKNMPVIKFRAGAISTTIWENQTEKDGKLINYKTISLERVYKDKDGNWKSTNSFRLNDLPKAGLAIQKAYEYLVLKGSNNSNLGYAEEEVY